MPDSNKVVIVGAGETAEIAYEYLTVDSPYDVVAFSVERQFLTKEHFFDLPLVPFEDLAERFPPDAYRVFVALSYTQLNRARTRLYREVKRLGYSPISYVSSHAFVWRTVEIGENCFIFENNVIQHGTRVGNNVVLWSGNHIGHQSVIRDNCFISSHVVVAGYCDIGENCFLGVNSCFADNITVAKDCIVGAGAVVVRNTEPGRLYRGNPAKPSDSSSFAVFGVQEEPS